MAEEKDIRISENTAEIVGKVSEYNITVKQKKMECNIDGEDKEITSAIIYGEISILVNGEIKKVKILTNKHTRSGNEIKNFTGLCTCAGIKYETVDGKVVYSKGDRPLQPIISGKTTLLTFKDSSKDEYIKREFEYNGVGTDNASLIKTVGTIDREIYLKKDKSDLVCDKKFSVVKVTTNTTEEEKASFAIEGYVNSIYDECDNNNEPTGRKMIELVPINYFGASVFTFVVPKSWEIDGETLTTQDFMDFCHEGETVTLNGDIQNRTIGKVQSNGAKRTFGKKADITNGYTVTEWVVKGADKDETSANSYKKEDIEKLLKEYNMYLDAEYNKRCKQAAEREKQSDNKSTNKQGLGRRNTASSVNNETSPFETDESPFVTDEDDPFMDELPF